MTAKNEFLHKLAAILEVPSVDEQYSLEGDNWDSLALLSTIALIDEQFGITVPAKQLADSATVREVLMLVRTSGAALE